MNVAIVGSRGFIGVDLARRKGIPVQIYHEGRWVE